MRYQKQGEVPILYIVPKTDVYTMQQLTRVPIGTFKAILCIYLVPPMFVQTGGRTHYFHDDISADLVRRASFLQCV